MSALGSCLASGRPQQRLKLLLCSILCNANLIQGHIIHAQCPQTPWGLSFLMAPAVTLKTQGFDVATMTLCRIIHELVPSRESIMPPPPPHTHTLVHIFRSLQNTNSVLTQQRGVVGDNNTHTQQTSMNSKVDSHTAVMIN